jgi:hypothetical protein
MIWLRNGALEQRWSVPSHLMSKSYQTHPATVCNISLWLGFNLAKAKFGSGGYRLPPSART